MKKHFSAERTSGLSAAIPLGLLGPESMNRVIGLSTWLLHRPNLRALQHLDREKPPTDCGVVAKEIGLSCHLSISSSSFIPVVISFSNAARLLKISPGGRWATS